MKFNVSDCQAGYPTKKQKNDMIAVHSHNISKSQLPSGRV